MIASTKRIDLPSGGWWEIRIRPNGLDAIAFKIIDKNTPSPEEDDSDGMRTTAEYIAQLTSGRGNGDTASIAETTTTALDYLSLDLEDLNLVAEVFIDEVTPFLERLQSRPNPKTSSPPSSANRRSRRSSPRSK